MNLTGRKLRSEDIEDMIKSRKELETRQQKSKDTDDELYTLINWHPGKRAYMGWRSWQAGLQE